MPKTFVVVSEILSGKFSFVDFANDAKDATKVEALI